MGKHTRNVNQQVAVDEIAILVLLKLLSEVPLNGANGDLPEQTVHEPLRL